MHCLNVTYKILNGMNAILSTITNGMEKCITYTKPMCERFVYSETHFIIK